ncbi:MAG: pro-sigmaK processing inhibitor BofA family protein [Oscillospiraceae bacterium]|jgi:hypothetical protein|nr:pro-sigmaK processing inhibitor BofA family protein [Oscillospiraceae bacterium]
MTDTLRILLYAVAAGAGLLILLAMLKSRRFVRNLILSAFSGVCGLYAVNALGMLTGSAISVNWFSLGVSAVGGVPGVIALLMAEIVMK